MQNNKPVSYTHLPVGLKETAAHAEMVTMPEITNIPILFLPVSYTHLSRGLKSFIKERLSFICSIDVYKRQLGNRQ